MKLKELLKFWDTLICGVLLAIGLITDNSIVLIAAIVIGGYKQTLEGLQDTIENKHLNVELLMILSAIGACLIGYYSEGAILIFIFAVSGALESFTLDQSQKEIRSLMERQPTTAVLYKEDNSTEEVDVNDLKIGDRVLVASGEIIPIDAMIVEGSSSIEEAAITGESLPVQKTEGDTVFGGTLNTSQPLVLEVNNEIGDTLIQKIVRMVEEAQNFPSKTARFIERLENIYAWIVLISVTVVILSLMFIFNHPFESAFYKGMILLVVASPCALIASVTPATLSAISNGARHGILVKGGIHFENLMDTKAVAFDKTGTLTQGIPSLINMEYKGDEESIDSAIYALEQYSSHPLANAIVSGIQSKYDKINSSANNIEEYAGYGVQGVVDGSMYRVGKLEYMNSKDTALINQASEWSNDGCSVVYVEKDNELVAVLGLIDEVREEAKALVSWLNNHNIETIMITGDVDATAQHIGKDVGIKRVISQTLPDQKAQIIKELEQEYGVVVMVGDGINDAPALANASIGIAMGGGTDIAMEAADIILVKDDIQSVQYAYQLSQKLRRIVIQNIIFSFSVIIILVVSNFMDNVSLPLGVVGHEGSTILVILNSLRVLKTLPKE